MMPGFMDAYQAACSKDTADLLSWEARLRTAVQRDTGKAVRQIHALAAVRCVLACRDDADVEDLDPVDWTLS